MDVWVKWDGWVNGWSGACVERRMDKGASIRMDEIYR